MSVYFSSVINGRTWRRHGMGTGLPGSYSVTFGDGRVAISAHGYSDWFWRTGGALWESMRDNYREFDARMQHAENTRDEK